LGTKIPVREGTFIEDAKGYTLVANKCNKCGQAFFPKASFCFTCFSEDMQDIELSRIAKLYSFTINRMPTSNFQPPHAVGYLEMPEGVRIFAPLAIVENKPFKIGMDMELYFDKLWQEGENDVIGYKFRPV